MNNISFSSLLEVKNLQLSLAQKKVLKNISFQINPGEIVGLVGESGGGKSLALSALTGILNTPHTLTGQIYFKNKSTTSLFPYLGKEIGFILQDPSLALNPVLPIETQLIEGLCYHKKLKKKEAKELALHWLERVGISYPSKRCKQYPHELSGGMKQRILIAIALMCQPLLVIADEPTTALDVTIQLQILDLLEKLQQEEKLSLLLVTHDLGVASYLCKRLYLLQEGEIVESGEIEELIHHPTHFYLQKLLQARSIIEKEI